MERDGPLVKQRSEIRQNLLRGNLAKGLALRTSFHRDLPLSIGNKEAILYSMIH